MAHYSAFNEAGQLNEVSSAEISAAFEYVHACAQEVPGALRWCPVCGQFYTLESVALFPLETTATPGAASARQVATFGECMVLHCTRCGAYAVGALDAQGVSHEGVVAGIQH